MWQRLRGAVMWKTEKACAGARPSHAQKGEPLSVSQQGGHDVTGTALLELILTLKEMCMGGGEPGAGNQ